MRLRTILSFLILNLLCSCGGYTTEGDKVYYVSYNEAHGKVKRNIHADLETFHVFDIDNYARDSRHVFYQGNVVESADPGSFVPLTDFYGRDKNYGYYGTFLIDVSDGQTFEVIDGNYARDKNDVYHGDKSLHSTSPKSFVILDIGHGNWAKDDNSYYYVDKKVPIKDYNSFVILDDDCYFAKDKYQVYKGDRVLRGVDAESFRFLKRCVGQDKFGCHNGSARCNCPRK